MIKPRFLLPGHHGLWRTLPVFGACLALLSATPGLAQIEAGQPSPAGPRKPIDPGTADKPTPSMIRAFLVPAEGSKASLQFRVQPQQEDVAPQVVAATDGAAVFNGAYQPIKPGGLAFELRSGEKVLASGSAPLQAARAYSFVAWESPSAGWQVKTFADDPATPNATDRAVRVLNFPAGRETLLTVAEGTEMKVPGNTVQEFRSAAKLTGVRVKVLAADGGPPAQSSVEMDFPRINSGYIVVVPDNLGRMRPQFLEGGYPEMEEVVAPAPVVASAPITPEEERKQMISAAQADLDSQKTVMSMIKAREAHMGTTTNATFLQIKREAEKNLEEMKRKLDAARAATPAPPSTPATAPQ